MHVTMGDIFFSSSNNSHGIRSDTLHNNTFITCMTSLSELRILDAPKEGSVLLLQLLSVRSHTKSRLPSYFNRNGVCDNQRVTTTKTYIFVCPNSAPGSNVAVLLFGNGMCYQFIISFFQ